MRYLLFKLCPLFFLMGLFNQPLMAQNDSLKILSYNIWNGFDWGKDLERKRKMTAWLKEVDADVIGFQELNNFTAEELKVWAKEIGHEYSVLLKEDGYPIGITSKQPIQLKTKMLGGLWHGMLHVKTYGIDFIVVHLSPHDWAFRRKEAEIISDYAQESILGEEKNKLIILGDFNSQSPFDINFDAQNTVSLKRKQHSDSLRRAENGPEAYQNLRLGTIDYSVISKFLSWPLIDVVQKKQADNNKKSFPTLVFGKDLSNSDFDKNQQRIDYILVSPNLEAQLIHAEISNQGAPDFLSDHYPVQATFKLNPKK
ncbi:exodeoxyribonuclease III [Cyclobacterium marinum]|uniref:exodeoxyribonuclease III n=1 Tax=Cyclobacterium marinum TaxID=104 RepID=UPI0011EE3FDB|nr:endonuclease/exonuclease/phosphatase family protein [Cyclobacterium marinum]MBI0398821.1 endonuclease/exonuclease/phosphatase family protein [Cyclobacterium marinum]